MIKLDDAFRQVMSLIYTLHIEEQVLEALLKKLSKKI
jgi:hypothetical protein